MKNVIKKKVKKIFVFGIIVVAYMLTSHFYGIYKNIKSMRAKQWYYKKQYTKIEDVWKLNLKVKRSITVAVIDTGVDYSHEVLKKHMWKNVKEIANNGVDDDNNGFIDDMIGWNFVDNNNDVMSGIEYYENDHGTECASIISAGSEWSGFRGVNYKKNVNIMSLKILKGIEKEGNIENLVNAIKYAEENGADICNLSINFKSTNKKLEEVISNSKMLFVVSAGNDGMDIDKKPVYMASYKYDNIISVATLDQCGNLSELSNYGEKSVDIAAPGENIYCAVVGGYDYDTGSSMATSIVTGVAAMIMACEEDYSLLDVKERILCNVEKKQKMQKKLSTGGILNACKCFEK